MQDRPENLKLLAAQRVAYETAKNVFGWQVLLTVAFAVALNFIRLLPRENIIDLLRYIIPVSVIVTLLDLFVFVKYISRLRTNGAKIQEQFDCTVYDIPWNNYNCGAPVDKNFIHTQYKKYRFDPHRPIENWYDINLEGLTQEKAILLCQETNLWYDSNLREKFKKVALFVLFGMLTISFIVSLVMKQDIGLMMIQVFAPILPAAVLAIKIYQENDKSTKAASELTNAVLSLKKSTNSPSIDDLRKIQDKIYCSRKDGSLVPEWFYRMRRPDLEEGMKINAS